MDANGASGSACGGNSAAVDAARSASFARTSNLRFILCGFVSPLRLYFLYALPALQIGIPWQIYLRIREGGWQYVLIMLLPFSVAVFPCFAFIALGAKWLLIGRYKEGKHKLWGWFYYRHWLVQRLHSYVPLVYLRGSPVLGLYFRLAGAEIGSNVFLNSHWLEAPDLISIGSDSSIGIDAQLINFHVEGNCQKQHTLANKRACFLPPSLFFFLFSLPKRLKCDSNMRLRLVGDGKIPLSSLLLHSFLWICSLWLHKLHVLMAVVSIVSVLFCCRLQLNFGLQASKCTESWCGCKEAIPQPAAWRWRHGKQ